jgi:aspartate racemase
MQVPTIGILAGMGPRSTAPFVDMLVNECQRQYGARDDIDFPPMMIYSLPAPFYLDRPLDHAALRDAITAGLRRLAGTGVALIAMPCNTAHIFFDQLAAAIDIPLLNMVDLALAALPAGAGRIALLATRPTATARLYQDAIERSGRAVYHDETLQQGVDNLLRQIKSSTDAPATRAAWDALLRDLAPRADAALLACTDLNAMRATGEPPLALVDATAILAAETVRAWRALR